MQNLLKETLRELERKGKSPSDVKWVGLGWPSRLDDIPQPKPVPLGSWSDFERFANFDYDEGFGGAEVNTKLVVVGDDWWLERGEYDGSEWWEFKALPIRPNDTTPLRPDDLRESL